MRSFFKKRFGLFFVFVLAGCMMISFQCGGSKTEVKEPESDDGPSEHTEVIIPDLGLKLELPKEASRIEALWKWEMPGVPKRYLGFNYKRFEPPMEPESILPGPSRILESEAVGFEWGSGRSYTMEIYAPISPSPVDEKAPVESVQHHFVITADIRGERFILDFFAEASDAEHLTALKPLLDQVAESAGKNLNHKEIKEYL